MIDKIAYWAIAIFFGAAMAIPLALGFLFMVAVFIDFFNGGVSCQGTSC